MVRSIALLLFCCQVAIAQDSPITGAFNPEQFDENPPAAELTDSVVSEKQAPPVVKSEDWNPKLVITLTTSPAGVRMTRRIVRRVPTFSTAFEESEVTRDEETIKVRVPVQTLTWREVPESISVPGSFQVLCDELSLVMDATESGPRYSFKCDGRLILHTQGSLIQAESASYSDGKLKLINAKVQQVGMAMEAETLTIAMTVFGVSTATSSVPSAAEAVDQISPEPDPAFEPGERNNFRLPVGPPLRDDVFDRRDELNPSKQQKRSNGGGEFPTFKRKTETRNG